MNRGYDMQMLHQLAQNIDITIGFVVAIVLGTMAMFMFMEWLAIGAFVAAGVYMEKFFIRTHPKEEKPEKDKDQFIM